MREIKFRAWSGKDFRYDVDNLPLSTLRTMGFVLQQYTGLKDKNGTEIYEGDIVNFYRASDVIGNYEVKFGEYQTELEHTLCWYAQGKPLAYAMSEAMPCEVIGNIHSNPELLGDSYDS